MPQPVRPLSALRLLVCPRCEKRYYRVFNNGAKKCRQCGEVLVEQEAGDKKPPSDSQHRAA